MKKLIFLVVGILLFFGIVGAANISILPLEGSVGLDCIESFDIAVDLLDGESIIGADVILESNMDFVKFVNGDMFQYSAPAKQKGNLVKLLLFSNKGNEITKGGILGKIYYKVNGVSEPYIKFVVKGEGDTTDTNLSIDGKDILKYANSGKYTIDSNKTCDHNIDLVLKQTKEPSLTGVIEQFQIDSRKQRIKNFFLKYGVYFVLGLIVVIIFLFFLRKKKHDNA